MKFLRRTAGMVAAASALAAIPGFSQNDPFSQMIRSAASFDVDSPVEVRAEFDPPEGVVGGHVIYRVSVTALEESFEAPEHPPAPAGLDLQLGGHGQNYEPTGGNKVRPRTTFVYHAVLTTNGTFTIPAFKAMAYGKTVEIPEATIKVAPAGAFPPQPPPLLIALPPKGDVFVGQMLTIPVALTQEPPHQIALLSEAKITGEFVFSEQFISGSRTENIEREGRTVPVFMEDVTVTPLRAGPQRLVAQGFTYLSVPVPNQPGAIRAENTLLDTEPFTIDVKPLPEEGKLPGFAGAVGKFRLDPPELSTNTVRAGEPLTLSLIIRGSGNIGRITPPAAPADKNWQSFPPNGEDLPPGVAQQVGSVRFTYTLIPLNAGVTATPPIPFSAFDPESKQYVDLTVPAVDVTVKPAPSGVVQQTASSPADLVKANAGNANEEKDLVMAGLAKTPGRAVGSLVPWEQRWSFTLLQLLPAAALGGLWIWDRRRRFLREHPEVVWKRRARRGMRRELRLAQRAAAARDAAGFARGAAGALREACAPHGAANPAALVCADVLRELPAEEQRGAEMVRRLFAAADALSFGGTAREGAELLALQPDLERVLEQLKTRL